MFGEGGGVGRLNLSGLVLLLGEGLCLREKEKINKDFLLQWSDGCKNFVTIFKLIKIKLSEILT